MAESPPCSFPTPFSSLISPPLFPCALSIVSAGKISSPHSGTSPTLLLRGAAPTGDCSPPGEPLWQTQPRRHLSRGLAGDTRCGWEALLRHLPAIYTVPLYTTAVYSSAAYAASVFSTEVYSTAVYCSAVFSGPGRGTEICSRFPREDRSDTNFRRRFMDRRSIVIDRRIFNWFDLRRTLEVAASSV